MKVLIVIESWFGNTRIIGDEVAAGLADGGADVQVMSVDDAPQSVPAEVDRLVLGAPTHNRGLSTAATRAQATKGGGSGGDIGIREWLKSAQLPENVAVAAFDTVTSKTWMSGSAAKGVVKTLSRRGIAVDAQSFVVTGTQGPLKPGEVEEAHEWGRLLAK